MDKEQLIQFVNASNLPEEDKQKLLQSLDNAGHKNISDEQTKVILDKLRLDLDKKFEPDILELDDIVSDGNKQMDQAQNEFDQGLKDLDLEADQVFKDTSAELDQQDIEDARTALK